MLESCDACGYIPISDEKVTMIWAIPVTSYPENETHFLCQACYAASVITCADCKDEFYGAYGTLCPMCEEDIMYDTYEDYDN